MDMQQALALVFKALTAVNALRAHHQQVALEPETVLIGDDGGLDSLALTTLILDLEDLVRGQTGRDISLMQDIDLEAAADDFRTPQRVAELLVEKTK